MKNISKLFLALFTLVIASCSVEDVEDRPIIEAIDAPVLTAPDAGSRFELTPATADKLFERFAWKPANFNGAVVITYFVEIAKLDDVKFEHPQTVQSSQTNNVAVTGDNLNKAAIALGLTAFVDTEVLARVKAVSGIGAGVVTNASETITITLNPYKTAPLLGVIGAHQGWNTAITAPYQLHPSAKGSPDFEGYVYLNGDFKFLEASDDLSFSWDNVGYGKGADAGVLDTKGGDFNRTAGYYLVKADTQKLTYATTLTNWGVIGDATPGGWDNSTNLTYDPATYVWTGTVNLLGTGKLKFRANNSWDINFGSDDANGILNAGGEDIPTPGAGTYKITLDLSHSRAYTYKLEKQ